jgi:hypothetical protein
MTVQSDFAKLQSEFNTLIYHYTRFTEKKVKGESTDVRKALSSIAAICKEMRASTQEHREKM